MDKKDGVIEFTTNSADETREIAHNLAREICLNPPKRDGALVIALAGNLGGGKTTFTQGFAHGLGIKDFITSPTFILMNTYPIPLQYEVKPHKDYLKTLVHIDAYRFEDPMQLHAIRWEDIIRNRENIVLVEWAENIKELLPPVYSEVLFEFLSENKRTIYQKLQWKRI
jgi:tRNA threonylcarbamoyladenosine biosynthesis protein TsaE